MTPSPSCGCQIVRGDRYTPRLDYVQYCPTHAQAFTLRESLEEVFLTFSVLEKESHKANIWARAQKLLTLTALKEGQ